MNAAAATRDDSLPPEEAARADCYGLLARLLYGPPEAELIASLAASGGLAGDGVLAPAWRELAQAAAAAQADAVRQEFDDAFVGAGKAPVSLYAGAYLQRFSSEAPLAELRGTLLRLGLARGESAQEPEDHIAGLCEVMRHLILEDHTDLGRQREFFERWIWPASESLCGAISTCPTTVFYRSVGRFAKSFFEIEHAAFEMI